jgi:hypothetical protein
VRSPAQRATPAKQASRVREFAQSLPVPWMQELRSSPDSRAGPERQSRGLADLLKRKRVELQNDLALEPRLVALARMLAPPAAIAAVPVAAGELQNGICRIAAPRTNSHSRCRIGENACGRSQLASRKCSANRSSTKAQRFAGSRVNLKISAAAFPDRSDRRCSQRLARPRSRGHTQRADGARQLSKRAQPIRSRARCAASRCLGVGDAIAKHACRKHGVSTDCELSKRLAKCSRRKLPLAMIHGTAQT